MLRGFSDMAKDYQKAKVYAWENEIVMPRDKFPIVPFSQIDIMVKSIWLASGFFHPPAVLERKITKKVQASGCREYISLSPDGEKRWVIIHELTHAMADDGHGPNYVGLYMKNLEEYLKIPLPLLMYTAQKAGVDFNLAAKAYFLDAA
jgi:hypothetical protein